MAWQFIRWIFCSVVILKPDSRDQTIKKRWYLQEITKYEH